MWKFCSSKSDASPYFTTLNNAIGRQTWEYDPQAGTAAEKKEVDRLQTAFTANRERQPHSADELLRLQSRSRIRTAIEAPKLSTNGKAVSEEELQQSLRAGISFYESLQQEDGHWPGDYGGPMFLMPGLLITLYTTGVLDKVLSRQHKHEMLRYLKNHQNADGGFGLHIEGPSTMFGTALR